MAKAIKVTVEVAVADNGNRITIVLTIEPI